MTATLDRPSGQPDPAEPPLSPTPKQTWRAARTKIFWGLCGLALLVIIAPVISVLISVFHQAAPHLGISLLTKKTSPDGTGGGLQNAIIGTLLLLLGVLVLAGSIGVLTGVYLAEFAPRRLGSVLRFASEILAGMPSIVIGYVGYLALVIGLHWGNSLAAAVLALSILVLPYIIKTTEVAMSSVPRALREASAGLGLSRTLTVGRILLPVAVPGIVSGLIIALAISTGETAPLLFTAGFLGARNPSFALTHHAVPYLTYVTYNSVSTDVPGSKAQAGAAAAVTMILLLILIGLSRLISARSRRATKRMAL